LDHFYRFVDRIFYESPARVRKERSRSERDAASIGGILLFITSPCLPSVKRSGAGEDRFGGKENIAATAKER
jgi:hypothetical protein